MNKKVLVHLRNNDFQVHLVGVYNISVERAQPDHSTRMMVFYTEDGVFTFPYGNVLYYEEYEMKSYGQR